MAWSIANGATSVEFVPLSGEIEQQYEMPTGVFWPLRGTDPVVQYGDMRKAALSTPVWLVKGDAARATMVSVLSSKKRLTLTDDTATVKYVRVVGGFGIRTQDTPERDTQPRYLVTVTLQEVS